MKRTISAFLLITIMMLTLSACGLGQVRIEDYEWELRCAWLVQDGEIEAVAVGDDDATLYPDAPVISVTLTAKNGKITITDVTHGVIYEGSYEVERNTPEGTDYTVVIDGKAGYATVAMTTYADGSEEPTLPINLGNYSLYFYEK